MVYLSTRTSGVRTDPSLSGEGGCDPLHPCLLAWKGVWRVTELRGTYGVERKCVRHPPITTGLVKWSDRYLEHPNTDRQGDVFHPYEWWIVEVFYRVSCRVLSLGLTTDVPPPWRIKTFRNRDVFLLRRRPSRTPSFPRWVLEDVFPHRRRVLLGEIVYLAVPRIPFLRLSTKKGPCLVWPTQSYSVWGLRQEVTDTPWLTRERRKTRSPRCRHFITLPFINSKNHRIVTSWET